MRIRIRENAIYKVCTQLDTSRDGLARSMGVASTTAYRVEQDKVEPSPKFIAALMTASGRPFEELFEIVLESEPEPVAS